MSTTDDKGQKAADARARQAQQEENREAADVTTGGDDYSDPYADLDLKSLPELRELASSAGVTINADVEKAHLISELRASRSGATASGGGATVENAERTVQDKDQGRG